MHSKKQASVLVLLTFCAALLLCRGDGVTGLTFMVTNGYTEWMSGDPLNLTTEWEYRHDTGGVFKVYEGKTNIMTLEFPKIAQDEDESGMYGIIQIAEYLPSLEIPGRMEENRMCVREFGAIITGDNLTFPKDIPMQIWGTMWPLWSRKQDALMPYDPYNTDDVVMMFQAPGTNGVSSVWLTRVNRNMDYDMAVFLY